MAFLAQISLALDRSLDYNQRLRSLADLTVPELAQLTVIDLLDDDGSVQSAVAAAPNPAHARAVEVMRKAHPLSLDSAHPVAAVLRSAQPVLLPDMSPTFLDEIAEGEDHQELMHRLAYHSAIVVPLIARRRALGTLSLLRMEGAPSTTTTISCSPRSWLGARPWRSTTRGCSRRPSISRGRCSRACFPARFP